MSAPTATESVGVSQTFGDYLLDRYAPHNHGGGGTVIQGQGVIGFEMINHGGDDRLFSGTLVELSGDEPLFPQHTQGLFDAAGKDHETKKTDENFGIGSWHSGFLPETMLG
jgi:hypothetical protein